jgi:hypothetical protein
VVKAKIHNPEINVINPLIIIVISLFNPIVISRIEHFRGLHYVGKSRCPMSGGDVSPNEWSTFHDVSGAMCRDVSGATCQVNLAHLDEGPSRK